MILPIRTKLATAVLQAELSNRCLSILSEEKAGPQVQLFCIYAAFLMNKLERIR